ncbi:MAG: Rrf2 family transcriptional regulator [Planctomycetota bacterium]|jgi:hypothetical protein
MKVSQATAYALHAMMYMVRHITQLPATTATIAKAEGIPAGYLAKIFRRLVKARLVIGKEDTFLQEHLKKLACSSCLKLLRVDHYSRIVY